MIMLPYVARLAEEVLPDAPPARAVSQGFGGDAPDMLGGCAIPALCYTASSSVRAPSAGYNGPLILWDWRHERSMFGGPVWSNHCWIPPRRTSLIGAAEDDAEDLPIVCRITLKAT